MMLWVKHFVAVSAHPDKQWANNADGFALRVHDYLAAIGEATHLVTTALADGQKLTKLVAGGN